MVEKVRILRVPVDCGCVAVFDFCLNCVVLWLEGSIGEDPNESA